MKIQTSLKRLLAIAITAVIALSCQSKSEDDNLMTAALLYLMTDGLSGTVVKGPVGSGKVSVYNLNDDGSQSTLLEETTTDASGRFQFRNRYQGERIEIEVTSGSYSDEATGETVQLTEQTRLRLQIAASESLDNVTVSPLTTMAAVRTRARIQAGATDVDGELVRAREEVASMFGISDVDPGIVACDDLTDANAQAAQNRLQTKYGLVLAGLSQVISDSSLPAGDALQLVYCYADDIADGDVDGLNGAVAATCSAGINSQAAHGIFKQAMNNFMINNRNQHRTELQGMSVPTPVNTP